MEFSGLGSTLPAGKSIEPITSGQKTAAETQNLNDECGCRKQNLSPKRHSEQRKEINNR